MLKANFSSTFQIFLPEADLGDLKCAVVSMAPTSMIATKRKNIVLNSNRFPSIKKNEFILSIVKTISCASKIKRVVIND